MNAAPPPPPGISVPSGVSVPPGGRVGILGGGQLARMLASAAAKLGLRTVIFEPDQTCVAAQTANDWIRAAYDDREALRRFADGVDVVTYEFENVPLGAVEAIIGAGADVRPGARALETAQDRLNEKRFMKGLGIETAPFMPVANAAAMGLALGVAGLPGILKTRRLGYDGKGQQVIHDEEEAGRIAGEMTSVPCLYEGFVPFAHEISVIGCRSRTGDFYSYEPALNIHEDGVLRSSTVPSSLDTSTLDEARDTAHRIMDALDYTGVMGTEFFVEKSGTLRVNEIAPRVHNSGHWTHEACDISQFEMHIRAICGWPLQAPRRHSDAVMTNILGEDIHEWHGLQDARGALVTLYGKHTARPGRKMGHVTQLGAAREDRER